MSRWDLRAMRAWIAVGLLAAAAMLPAVVLVMQAREIAAVMAARADPVSILDRSLPASGDLRGRAKAGYLAPPPGTSGDDVSVRRRFLAQYALAPTVLVEDIDEPLLVADCADRPFCADLLRANDLEVARDLGGGFILLRKPSR